MKFIVDRESFITSIRTATEAAARKSTDATSGVRLSIQADTGLNVSGTDREQWVTTTLEAQCQKSGAVAFDGVKLAQFLDGIPDDKITVTLANDDRLGCKTSGGNISLATRSADDWPEPRYLIDTTKPGMKLSAAGLDLALSRVDTLVAGKENARYATTGVAFDCRKKNSLAVMATDTKAAGVATCANVVSGETGELYIVPAKAIRTLRRMLQIERNAANGGEVQIHFHTSGASFRVGDFTTLVSCLVVGTFPDVERVWPKAKGSQMSLCVEGGVAALRRIAPTLDEHVALAISCGDKELHLTTESSHGKAQATLPIQECRASKDDEDIRLDATLMGKVLKASNSSSLSLGLHGKEKPLTLESDDVKYIIMPYVNGE